MRHGIIRRLARLERSVGTPNGEVVIPVLDTPEARQQHGITGAGNWVRPFWTTLSDADARRLSAKRGCIVFLSKAEWEL